MVVEKDWQNHDLYGCEYVHGQKMIYNIVMSPVLKLLQIGWIHVVMKDIFIKKVMIVTMSIILVLFNITLSKIYWFEDYKSHREHLLS